MGMYIREHDLLKNEIKDMLIADLALSFAFAVIFAGGDRFQYNLIDIFLSNVSDCSFLLIHTS